jgi:hypothetical protein
MAKARKQKPLSTAAIEKRLKEIDKQFSGKNTVRVGLPRNSQPYPDGTSVIMVGTVHEFGSPKMRIPPRSFLRSTIIYGRSKYLLDMKKLAASVSKGKRSIDKAMGLLGLRVSTDVKETITKSGPDLSGGTFKQLSTRTLQGRLNKDKYSAKPLMDTGHLRATITFTVGDE